MTKPKGDYRSLEKIISATGRIASEELVRNSVQAFADETHRLAVEGAQAGKNPQGRTWKKLKTGGVALRSYAGRMRLKIRAKRGFEIRVADKVSLIHQRGAKKQGTKWKLPARRILPKKAMPKPWADRVTARLNTEWFALVKT